MFIKFRFRIKKCNIITINDIIINEININSLKLILFIIIVETLF